MMDIDFPIFKGLLLLIISKKYWLGHITWYKKVIAYRYPFKITLM